jgi:S-adenosylmethionine hydrolase
MRSNIITLITDMGNKDYYVASIKGKIYSLLSSVNVVDISHEIKPFDIAHASYVLRNCYSEFPMGSVHIIGVNPESTDDIHHSIIKYNGHYFVGADNGFFSLLCGTELPEKIVRIDQLDVSHNQSFPTKDIFVSVAVALASGTPMENLGTISDTIVRKQLFRPTAEETVIKGTVSYIDAYGNIITNITKELFDEICNGRTFSIYLTRAGYTITKIHKKYNEVPQGEKVALFSSTGTLEISINKGVEGSGGGANKLFGIKLNDTITIEFNNPKPSNSFEI